MGGHASPRYAGRDLEHSAAETRSSEEIRDENKVALDADSTCTVGKTDHAAVVSTVDGAAQVVEETFYLPRLAHAAMEPMNCTFQQDADGGITLHDAAQIPTIVHGAYAQIFEFPMAINPYQHPFGGRLFWASRDAGGGLSAAASFKLRVSNLPVDENGVSFA